MTKLKFLLATLTAIGTTMSMSTTANAWSATYLQGQNWAIICANGKSFSYNGSSAGLDIVGPGLCPGGIVGPGGGDIISEIAKLEKRGAMSKSSSVGFPPHGYPCLGCIPCPGNPEEFCDTVWNVAAPAGLEPGQVVWSTKGMDAKTRSYMVKRYNLRNVITSEKKQKPFPTLKDRIKPKPQRR